LNYSELYATPIANETKVSKEQKKLFKNFIKNKFEQYIQMKFDST